MLQEHEPWLILSRMITLDNQARQQMTRHFQLSLPIVTSMQRFTHHQLRQAYSKEKEKVATYILV